MLTVRDGFGRHKACSENRNMQHSKYDILRIKFKSKFCNLGIDCQFSTCKTLILMAIIGVTVITLRWLWIHRPNNESALEGRFPLLH
jgi:hypothetical protein